MIEPCMRRLMMAAILLPFCCLGTGAQAQIIGKQGITTTSPYQMRDTTTIATPVPGVALPPVFTTNSPAADNALNAGMAGLTGSTGLQMPVQAPRIPHEGETAADGKKVHYEMAAKNPNMGTGILSDVELPQRTFNNVEPNY